MVVAVDIDNTVLDARWRTQEPAPPKLTPDGKSVSEAYQAWLARCLAPSKLVQDPPIKQVRRLVFSLMVHGGYEVYFVTSRNESLRAATAKWLTQEELFRGHNRLLMRSMTDYRPDGEYKLARIAQIASGLTIVLDDLKDQALIDGCAQRGWVYLQVHDQGAIRGPRE